jgi:PAS domain S-box-containing protein
VSQYRRAPVRETIKITERAVPTIYDDAKHLLATDADPRRAAMRTRNDPSRQSRERLELMRRAAKLGTFDYWPQTGALDWDHRCRELFGMTTGRPVIYGDYLAGIHPDDRERAALALATALDPNGTHRLETEYRTIGIDDGQERCIVAQGLVFFENRQPVRVIGTVQDVTASRRAVAALRETEERLRLATYATNDVIWDWDLASDTILWNDALYRKYGYDAASVEPSGEWWLSRIHHDDRERVERYISRVIEGSASAWQDEYRFLRADGSCVDIVDRGYVLRNEQGVSVRMIGAMLDITDRKRAERDLRSMNDRLEERVLATTADRDRMWRMSPDLLIILDEHGLIHGANPSWKTLLGYDADEVVGKRVDQFVHPEDARNTLEAARHAVQTAIPHFENRYRHKHGGYRTLAWRSTFDAGMIFANGRDVTVERAREAELGRTQELLRQAQKMDAVGQLTGGIAHDFNNMLTGVMGGMEMIRLGIRESRFDRVDRYVDAVMSSAQRAAALTHRLLAFSRQQAPDIRPTDVNHLIGELAELLKRSLGENVELRLQFEPLGWWANTDANQLESSLLNLTINAREAMPDYGLLRIETGKATVTASEAELAEGLAPGEYVVVRIADTGHGMPADVLEKATEPFFTTKLGGQGSGLGLSMLYAFAAQTGGHVRMESEPGSGTLVEIFLPRYRGGEMATDMPTTLALAPAQGEHVLVIEDDPAVRMLVMEFLGELGYKAIDAADGHTGLAVINSNARIDLLLTDVGLPGMNGRQVADIARQIRPGLHVLFMTGYVANAKSRGEFGRDGMGLILKPFAIDDLARKMRAVID